MRRIRIVCNACGRDDISADATARFSVEAQIWVLTNVFYKGRWCDDCDCEVRTEALTIEDDPLALCAAMIHSGTASARIELSAEDVSRLARGTHRIALVPAEVDV